MKYVIEAVLKDQSLHWLLHPPRVAIVGAANVGKSTLANRLFAQERSITADVPGTTRDWVGELANLDGLAVQLVDTPGIRQTTDSIEREAIERAGTQIGRADLLVLVLDASCALEPEQAALMARFPDALRVVNKVDTKHAWEIGSIDAIHTIATTGQGVAELMQRVRAHFGCDNLDPNRARCWTERQRELLLTRHAG
jgi:tRNA modification GTPase